MRGVLEVPESLLPINEAILAGLERVEARFDAQLETDIPPVADLCKHIERYRGKMLRPTLVLLTGLAAHPDAAARLAAGDDLTSLWSDEHTGLGAVVEMVHMATLVHDDVLDDAEIRRRGQTVNALRGNEAAVILGDYLLASAYHLCSAVESRQAALAVGDTAMTMASGELLQLHHREDLSLDEPTYYEIVDRKTGALIGLSCSLGAAASGADDETVDALKRFGRDMGIAFQIKDDLLDLMGEETVIGKSVRRDLAKGKLTLPLIHALAEASPETRGHLLREVKNLGEAMGGEGDGIESPAAGAAVDQLVATMRDLGSIEYAKICAETIVARAKGALAVLPESPVRDFIEFSADAVIDRRF
jgi:octaprenyl-diphosphate synthase